MFFFFSWGIFQSCLIFFWDDDDSPIDLGAPKGSAKSQALRSDAKPLSPMACALAVLPVADVRLA